LASATICHIGIAHLGRKIGPVDTTGRIIMKIRAFIAMLIGAACD
jgi:hypothetical protein